MKPTRTNRYAFVLVMMLIAMLTLAPVHAAVAGTNATISQTSTAQITSAQSASDTRGGTQTQLDLTLLSQTLHWQGFYGNVTSMFRVEDNVGSVFYEWNNPIPQGTIFATRSSSIDWTQIECAGYDTVIAEQAITGERTDRVNNTFTASNNHAFSVADTQFTPGQCTYSAYTLDSSGGQSAFEEVLLQSQGDIVYASIIEADSDAYSGEIADFQMVVAEDGTDDVNTPYYFYAEIK